MKTEEPKQDGKPPLPCDELFSVDPARDWPWGEGDNDNYQNECWACGEQFRGHKHSRQCYYCYRRNKDRRAAMTQEERDAEDAELLKKLAEHYSENDQADRS